MGREIVAIYELTEVEKDFLESSSGESESESEETETRALPKPRRSSIIHGKKPVEQTKKLRSDVSLLINISCVGFCLLNVSC